MSISFNIDIHAKHLFNRPEKAFHAIPNLIHLAMTRYPESYGPMLGLMSNADLAPGGVIGLHLDDIDFRNNSITVRRSIDNRMQVQPGKYGERTIPLTPEAMAFLAQCRKVRQVNKSTPQVFQNDGRYLHIRSLIKHMQRLASELGMKNFSRHVLMRYFSQQRQLRLAIAAKH